MSNYCGVSKLLSFQVVLSLVIKFETTIDAVNQGNWSLSIKLI